MITDSLTRQMVRLGLALAVIGLVGLSAAQPGYAQQPAISPSNRAAQPDTRPAAQQSPNESTLEIVPQRSGDGRRASTQEVPAHREFERSDNASGAEHGLERQRASQREPGYLGVHAQQGSQCILSADVHGWEVVSIDPDSPAADSPLKPRARARRSDDSSFLGFLNSLRSPEPGDLIIEVNGRRVVGRARTLNAALGEMRAGETATLTVIRADLSGGYQMLDIPIKLGSAHKSTTSR